MRYGEAMPGTRGEYRKSAERRRQIVAAAFDVFARSGYAATSINEIARAVGMSATAVVHQFPGGKLALLRAVLEQRDERARAALTGLRGRAFLAATVGITREQVGLRGAVQLHTVLAAEATDPDHPAHEHFRERMDLILSGVTRAFDDVRSEGGLRDGVDPRHAAMSVIATLTGLELLWLNDFEVDLPGEMRRRLDGFLVEPLSDAELNAPRAVVRT